VTNSQPYYNTALATTMKSFSETRISLQINLALIIEGTTEKISQFTIAPKSVCSKKLCFNEQKCIFEHCRSFGTRYNL
jgi:hypothetical protein